MCKSYFKEIHFGTNLPLRLNISVIGTLKTNFSEENTSQNNYLTNQQVIPELSFCLFSATGLLITLQIKKPSFWEGRHKGFFLPFCFKYIFFPQKCFLDERGMLNSSKKNHGIPGAGTLCFGVVFLEQRSHFHAVLQMHVPLRSRLKNCFKAPRHCIFLY